MTITSTDTTIIALALAISACGPVAAPADAGPRPDAHEPPPAYIGPARCDSVRPSCPYGGLPGCVVAGRREPARCEWDGYALWPVCRSGGHAGCWTR